MSPDAPDGAVEVGDAAHRRPRSFRLTNRPAPRIEVVEDLDPHERARGGEPSRERDVLRRGLGIAGRMVVEEDERGRARDHGLLEDLPRMHERRRQAADRDHRLALEPVADVEGQDAERLDRPRAVARQEVAGRFGRSAEARATGRGPPRPGARPARAWPRRAPPWRGRARAPPPARPRDRPASPRSPDARSRCGHVERGASRASPCPARRASSSRLESAPAPWRSSRSRGRSSAGRSSRRRRPQAASASPRPRRGVLTRPPPARARARPRCRAARRRRAGVERSRPPD